MLNNPVLLEVKIKLIMEHLCFLDSTTKPPPSRLSYAKVKAAEQLFYWVMLICVLLKRKNPVLARVLIWILRIIAEQLLKHSNANSDAASINSSPSTTSKSSFLLL